MTSIPIAPVVARIVGLVFDRVAEVFDVPANAFNGIASADEHTYKQQSTYQG
jgi:hypothetical protein